MGERCWEEIGEALARGHRAANRDQDMYLSASHWNDSNPPPAPRYAERQRTNTENLRAPNTDMARVAEQLKRIGDLLERIAAELDV